MVLSPVAIRLWRYIKDHQSAELLMSDLTTDLRASKTAIRNALAELASQGCIALEVE